MKYINDDEILALLENCRDAFTDIYNNSNKLRYNAIVCKMMIREINNTINNVING